MSAPPTPLSTGAALHALAARLYPIPRSITGPGVRETLAILAERAPFAARSIPSGTPVLDWEVPKEWRFRSARLRAPDGTLIADAARQNLQVLNFGAGFHGSVPLEELRAHLFSLPDRPDRIPYRTSYWREAWGFCLPHRVVRSLGPGDYRVEIDAEHVDGVLDYAEAVLPGEGGAEAAEVLVSTHCCHPQMANDNLSGLVVATALAAELAARPRRRHAWRVLLAPGTIGAIAWLATHEREAARIRAGLVVAGLGDSGGFHYKRSRRGDAAVDRAVPRALERLGERVVVEPFLPFGYDERQYNSPGYDLPVGSFGRTPWGRYPEYHTDADDLDFVRPGALERSLAALRAVVDELEATDLAGERPPAHVRPPARSARGGAETYLNLKPKGEPRLGRHGLYRSIGGDEAGRELELALLWVLNLSDGEHGLPAIAARSGLPVERLRDAAEALLAAGLLARA